VGVVLQCCLGGDRIKFNVCQLSDHRFHFSVASNRVGHFIYGFRDRVWPDFVCHFSLFHGDSKALLNKVDDAAACWNPLGVWKVKAKAPSSITIKPNLDVLMKSAALDGSSLGGFHHSESSSSCKVLRPILAKGASDPDLFRCGDLSFNFSNSKLLTLNASVSSDKPRFVGAHFWNNCESFSGNNELLEKVLDLREANYQEEQIEKSLNLFGMPDNETIFSLIGKCHSCNFRGHIARDCPSLKLGGPLGFRNDSTLSGPMRCCFCCLELGHLVRNCPNKIRCVGCFGWGHKAKFCEVNPLCGFCSCLGHRVEACPRIICSVCNAVGYYGHRCPREKIWVKKATNHTVISNDAVVVPPSKLIDSIPDLAS
jgi:hypothetical protein